jgi:hypothetical protein
MEQKLENYFKKSIQNFDRLINIKFEDDKYSVKYVAIDYYEKEAPKFSILKETRLNLKSELRHIKIESLLETINDVDETSFFDVEDIIYNEEQRARIDKLRNPDSKSNSEYDILNQSKKKYSESFKLGDKIWYKGYPGFITFEHKNRCEDDLNRFSVKVKDTEVRYVKGTLLAKRVVRDLSFIEIDPTLNKLSTEKLLKMYKRNRDRNNGVGDLKIKRILQEREHIQKTPNKIVIL